MKKTQNVLLSIVLIGIIIIWGPTVFKQLSDWLAQVAASGQQNIEEQAGVPVFASWREATGPGKVMILDYRNTRHPMVVTVQITRPSTGETKSVNMEFNPQYKETRNEIGWMEGWSFQLGDKVHLSSGNYTPRDFVLK